MAPQKKGKRRRQRRPLHQTTATSGLTLAQAAKRFDKMAAHAAVTTTPIATYRQSTWVYGSINLIATAIGNTPFRVYDHNDNPIESGPLPSLIKNPSQYPQQKTDTKFRIAYMSQLLLSGAVLRTFPEIEGHRPKQMLVMPRSACVPTTDTDAAGMDVVLRWNVISTRGERIYVEGMDVHHDGLWNPFHDWEGLAPLAAAILSITNNASVQQFTNRYFQADASSGLIMTTENDHFNNAMAKEAQDRWNEECGGADNAFGVKFVGMGLTPHNVGGVYDAEAQRIIATMTKEEIVTGIFRIPADIFGSGDRNGSGVTIGAQSIDPAKEMFLVNVLIPWAKWYDDEFNTDVTWRFDATAKAKHDFSDNPILEGRRLERAKTAVILIDRGVPLNEVIRWLRLEIQEQPHGDEFWAPNWLVPASVILKHADAVYSAGAKGGNENGRNAQAESQAEHVSRILTLAQQMDTLNLARADEQSRFNGTYVSNADRVKQLAPTLAEPGL